MGRERYPRGGGGLALAGALTEEESSRAMTTSERRPWLRVLVGTALMGTLALCSAADPEEEKQIGELQAMLEEERWDDAIAAAGVVLEEEPENARVRAKLGLALLGKARNEEQVLDEDRFDRLQQSTEPADFFNPSLTRTEVEFDDSLREKASAELDRALQSDPDNLDALIGMAKLHAEAERTEQEVEFLSRAAAAHAGDEEAGRRLISFGERYFARGEYDQALEIFTVLDESFGKIPEVALDYSAALFASGKYDEGLKTLQKAASANRENQRILMTLGQMHLFRKNWAQAAEAFGSAAKLAPDDALLQAHEAAALMPVDATAARGKFQAMVDADPGVTEQPTMIAQNLQVALADSRVNAADLVMLADDLNRARLPQIATAVGGLLLSRDPDSIAARLVLASVYDGMRYFDLALEILDEASVIILDNPAAAAGQFGRDDLVASYARAYMRKGDFQKAVDMFLSADNPARFRFGLGVAYESMEDYEKAYAIFQEVADGANPQQTKAARQRMQNEVFEPYRVEP